MNEMPLWEEVEYVQPLNGNAPYWATFDLGSVIGVRSTRYVRGDRLHRAEAEVSRLREALHDTMAALGAPRDEPTCGYVQVATTALAAERERVVTECVGVIDGHVAMWRSEARRTEVARYAREYTTNAEVMEVAARSLRALTPASAMSVANTPAPGAADTHTEGT